MRNLSSRDAINHNGSTSGKDKAKGAKHFCKVRNPKCAFRLFRRVRCWWLSGHVFAYQYFHEKASPLKNRGAAPLLVHSVGAHLSFEVDHEKAQTSGQLQRGLFKRSVLVLN